MKKSVDFIKIKDYAVINLNNMIPVSKEQLIELDINAEKDPHYKFLLQAESREINRQKNRINIAKLLKKSTCNFWKHHIY